MAGIPIDYNALERGVSAVPLRASESAVGGGEVVWALGGWDAVVTETEKALLAQNPAIVRGVAQIVLMQAVRATPPNASTGRNYKKEPGKAAVKRLQNRIAQDLMGSIKNPHTARVVKAGDKWLAVDEEHSAPRSGINFIVPRNNPKGLQYADPDAVIGSQTVRFKRGEHNVRRIGTPSDPIFVRAADLKRAVKKRQDEAGDLIAGWAAAGKALSPSKSNNWDPGRGARKKRGFFEFTDSPTAPTVNLGNDWGDTVVGRQAKHFERDILTTGTRDVNKFVTTMANKYFGK